MGETEAKSKKESKAKVKKRNEWGQLNLKFSIINLWGLI